MDGLECSEIFKKDLERTLRIDSEFYSKENLDIEKLLQKMEYASLTELVDVSDGNHMSISDKFISDGIPYYRGQDVKSFFIEDSTPVCIDDTSFNSSYMKRSHLQKGDVLLSIVGTIGNLSLVNSNQRATCSCKLAILRPKQDTSGEILATFLTSKYGQNQIKKYTRGAIQMGLILEDMDQLLVPRFSKEFVEKIKKLFILMNEVKLSSKKYYEQANGLLKQFIPFTYGSNDKQIEYTTKSLSKSLKISGRLDAEYYQPRYEEVESAISCRKHTTLDAICDVETGEFISETFYGNVGIPYIRGAEITAQSIDDKNAIKVNINVNGLKTIETNDLAFALIGSVGNVSVNRGKTSIVSNNLGTIKPHNKKLSHYLLVYLLSDIGQTLFEKYQTRTAQPKIKKEDVEKFLIPILPDEDVEYISIQVKESFELKEKADMLLEIAVKAVEIAIEQNENKAIQWMKEKGVE